MSKVITSNNRNYIKELNDAVKMQSDATPFAKIEQQKNKTDLEIFNELCSAIASTGMPVVFK